MSQLCLGEFDHDYWPPLFYEDITVWCDIADKQDIIDAYYCEKIYNNTTFNNGEKNE